MDKEGSRIGQYQKYCKQLSGQLGPTDCFIAQYLIGQARTGGSPRPDDGSTLSNGPMFSTETWNGKCLTSISRVEDGEKSYCGDCPKQDRIKPLVEDLTSQKRAAGELI